MISSSTLLMTFVKKISRKQSNELLIEEFFFSTLLPISEEAKILSLTLFLIKHLIMSLNKY